MSSRCDRSKWDERVAAIAVKRPSRRLAIGPPARIFPCSHEFRRAIDGRRPVSPAALRPGDDPVAETTLNQSLPDPRGVRVIARPGALRSIGINPVATSTRSHMSTPGSSSGVPVPFGSVMSTSPSVKSVCVQVLPCAPTRAGSPALSPPVSIRSAMTSGTAVSSSENRLPGAGSIAERIDRDGAAERRTFGDLRGHARRSRREREDRHDREESTIESRNDRHQVRYRGVHRRDQGRRIRARESDGVGGSDVSSTRAAAPATARS